MNLRIILVEPLYEGNVGSVARAMKNFGFHDLVMVNPCKIEDFGSAMASHARDVLQMARTYAGLPEALQGCNLVVGTTGKRLDEAQHHLRLHLRVPCFTPAELAKKLTGKEGTVALLLGREDCGLNSQELALCDMLVSIPTSRAKWRWRAVRAWPCCKIRQDRFSQKSAILYTRWSSPCSCCAVSWAGRS
jgi:tRNA/rRNA methyltransferase